ncbi:cytochrome c oxidase subunit II [Aquirufa nivalisilvae]|jgi:cytochrome c oxidase subunit 2|uniref:Cytochrome c oxidase subunit 2 n=1 Tax=Aquirufa nivalisilvae TaxID=2516557 RepID=A0A2S2DS64_9BACT|nr:cytochrome c oxidase subunit II [Aquirufa nivalisilvae]AWL08215.1 Cytochrome-c oxidase [Aquirufa nivalisilvae]MCZ2478684.1 cytochrome c oxidase subunit II [Aquirufa nivalisilvae]MCZ2483423.1 cytochrome c oxidase subunit II [Aquirufa nivalisilvae]TBH75624.1 cytochrome c oxidase subunit II [Aquirufa nivalisilvae]
MNYLVGLLSVVFFILAITVISKSLKLNKNLSGENESDSALDSHNNTNAFGFLLFWLFGTIAGVWSFLHSKPDFLPVAASEHGVKTDSMFWISMAVVTFAFFITNSLLFFFAFQYRNDKNRKATFYPVNHKLEIIWTIIPAIVMAILVFTGWRTWRDITSQAPSNAVVIEVTGHQFGWYVRYAGNDDSQLGNINYKLIDETNSLGLDFTDKNSFDDFTANELHLPKGVPVLLKIRAQDVLHSVYLPFQRVKMDAVPGMPTKFWFTPTISTDEMRAKLGKKDFNFKLNCTEICGRGHFGMAITVFVDEPADYKKWVSEQKPFLTMNPAYLSKVPENLKAKASKYIPAEPIAADSTATEAVSVK